LLYSLSLCYCLMKNCFAKVKKSQAHLLMIYNSIRNMFGYTFLPPKMNMWSDC